MTWHVWFSKRLSSTFDFGYHLKCQASCRLLCGSILFSWPVVPLPRHRQLLEYLCPGRQPLKSPAVSATRIGQQRQAASPKPEKKSFRHKMKISPLRRFFSRSWFPMKASFIPLEPQPNQAPLTSWLTPSTIITVFNIAFIVFTKTIIIIAVSDELVKILMTNTITSERLASLSRPFLPESEPDSDSSSRPANATFLEEPVSFSIFISYMKSWNIRGSQIG